MFSKSKSKSSPLIFYAEGYEELPDSKGMIAFTAEHALKAKDLSIALLENEFHKYWQGKVTFVISNEYILAYEYKPKELHELKYRGDVHADMFRVLQKSKDLVL